MDTRDNQYTDNLLKRIDSIQIVSPADVARTMALYTRVMNDSGVVNNVSLAYIDSYDGNALYRKYAKHFDRIYELFLKNSIDDSGRHYVMKRVAARKCVIPKKVSEMKYIVLVVIDETKKLMKDRKTHELRMNLVSKFKLAIKKYLHLTYELGYNEPSLCVKTLARTHRLDKYVLSGDFSLLLLPFLPDVEDTIRSSYEHYEMKDTWEMFKGRYFNYKNEYSILATEIKAGFGRNIVNFSDYFDIIYSDTYYKMMIGKEVKR